jgi:predicted esterase
MQTEKKVSYTALNTYSTLNEFTYKTKNTWFSFHGMGYLSRYFLKYFEALNPDENYIVAPQAPSKYYQGKNFNYVGASWLTKENTTEETKNVLSYIDAVSQNETIQKNEDKLIVFGFSQGVSVALRWVASRKVNCKTIVIHSGGIPKELTAEDFSFLNKNTKVYVIYGAKDEYLTEERMYSELTMAQNLFGERLQVIPFDGNHSVNKEIIFKISTF